VRQQHPSPPNAGGSRTDDGRLRRGKYHAAFRLARRRRSRTYQPMGYHGLPVLKIGRVSLNEAAQAGSAPPIAPPVEEPPTRPRSRRPARRSLWSPRTRSRSHPAPSPGSPRAHTRWSCPWPTFHEPRANGRGSGRDRNRIPRRVGWMGGRLQSGPRCRAGARAFAPSRARGASGIARLRVASGGSPPSSLVRSLDEGIVPHWRPVSNADRSPTRWSTRPGSRIH
jgi:hypothetical protein